METTTIAPTHKTLDLKKSAFVLLLAALVMWWLLRKKQPAENLPQTLQRGYFAQGDTSSLVLRLHLALRHLGIPAPLGNSLGRDLAQSLRGVSLKLLLPLVVATERAAGLNLHPAPASESWQGARIRKGDRGREVELLSALVARLLPSTEVAPMFSRKLDEQVKQLFGGTGALDGEGEISAEFVHQASDLLRKLSQQ